MILTVASYKGGVGKTTTAIHLAAYLSTLAPTILVDGDAIRSATKWSQRGDEPDNWNQQLPFKVISHAQLARHAKDYTHIVIDTEANPSDDDFRDLVDNCDLMVIPATLDTVATDGLTHTLQQLAKLSGQTKPDRYRVLLTMASPHASRWTKKRLPELSTTLWNTSPVRDFYAECEENEIPTFLAFIPRLAAFEKAAAAGITVKDVKDRNAARAWGAYEDVGREIVEIESDSMAREHNEILGIK